MIVRALAHPDSGASMRPKAMATMPITESIAPTGSSLPCFGSRERGTSRPPVTRARTRIGTLTRRTDPYQSRPRSHPLATGPMAPAVPVTLAQMAMALGALFGGEDVDQDREGGRHDERGTDPHRRQAGDELGHRSRFGGRHAELPFLMIRAVKAMVTKFTSEGDQPSTARLTTMHSIAARYFESHVDVTTVELASDLRVTKQSASEIVTLLDREGYVRRRRHPADGRARVVELTDDGVAGLARSRSRWDALVAEWESLVGPESLATLKRALEAYLDADPPMS